MCLFLWVRLSFYEIKKIIPDADEPRCSGNILDYDIKREHTLVWV